MKNDISQYRVLIKRYDAEDIKNWKYSADYITIFYDFDRDVCVKAMRAYVKSNGFSFEEYKYGKMRRFTCANILLIGESSEGDLISVQTYKEAAE